MLGPTAQISHAVWHSSCLTRSHSRTTNGHAMTAPVGRDLRIDFLRGAVIVAMVVDHVGGDHSWLYALTGGNRFYVSAAEGFVFLAGVVCGMVYGPRAALHGGVAAARLLRRSGIIYLWTMALTLTAPFVASWLQLGWDDPLRRYSPAEFVIRVLTLHLAY